MLLYMFEIFHSEQTFRERWYNHCIIKVYALEFKRHLRLFESCNYNLNLFVYIHLSTWKVFMKYQGRTILPTTWRKYKAKQDMRGTSEQMTKQWDSATRNMNKALRKYTKDGVVPVLRVKKDNKHTRVGETIKGLDTMQRYYPKRNSFGCGSEQSVRKGLQVWRTYLGRAEQGTLLNNFPRENLKQGLLFYIISNVIRWGFGL